MAETIAKNRAADKVDEYSASRESELKALFEKTYGLPAEVEKKHAYGVFTLKNYETVMLAENQYAKCAGCSEWQPACRSVKNPPVRTFGQDGDIATIECGVINHRKCSVFKEYELNESCKASGVPESALKVRYKTDGANSIATAAVAKILREDLTIGLYLYGEPGVGKSTLAAKMTKELIRRGKRVWYVKVPNILQLLKSTFNGKSEEHSEESILQRLYRAQWLILDDICAEKPSEWSVSRLYLVINERLEKRRPIVFTSNYSLREMEEQFNSVSNKQGSRIASRIRQMAKELELEGADRRLNNKWQW